MALGPNKHHQNDDEKVSMWEGRIDAELQRKKGTSLEFHGTKEDLPEDVQEKLIKKYVCPDKWESMSFYYNGIREMWRITLSADDKESKDQKNFVQMIKEVSQEREKKEREENRKWAKKNKGNQDGGRGMFLCKYGIFPVPNIP